MQNALHLLPRLHEVNPAETPWGCIDKRSGAYRKTIGHNGLVLMQQNQTAPLRFGIAGGVDGLRLDLDGSVALQSENKAPLPEAATHIRAALTFKQLGARGVYIANHHDCKAIDNREAIVDTIADTPEVVYEVVQHIDPTVTEDHVGILSDHYKRVREQRKVVHPAIAKPIMEATIDTVTLEEHPHQDGDSLFIVNNIDGVAFERGGDHYEYSLAALRGLQKKIHADGLYPVTHLTQSASTREAATSIVLGRPEVVRLGEVA